MKSQFVALAIVLAALPALAWGQASCGCTSRVGTVRPASYGAWSDYQPAGSGCNSCVSRAPSCGSRAPSCGSYAPSCGSYAPSCGSRVSSCCQPCCGRQLLCIIPNTVKKIGCALDCLIPRGPICCSSGCGSMGCTSGCPSCSSPATMENPFQDDDVLLPMPPKPAPQETRRQPSMQAPRQMAAAPKVSSPATKSILTRASQPSEEPVSRANHSDTMAKPVSVVKRTSATVTVSDEVTRQSSRRSADAAIPHNPLR